MNTTHCLIALVAFLLALILVGRTASERIIYIKDKRIEIKAQRLMLRFCKDPTRRNWEATWDFINDNEVMLGGLDWPLVERFTKTAVTINFTQGL